MDLLLLLLFVSCVLALLIGGAIFLSGSYMPLLDHIAGFSIWIDTAAVLIVGYLVYAFILTIMKLLHWRIDENQARFRNIVETSPLASIVLVDGKIAYYNSPAIALTGINIEHDPCLGLSYTHFVAPMDIDAVEAYICSLPESRPNRFYPIHLERSDGRLVPVKAAAKPMTYEGQDALLVTLQKVDGWSRLSRWLRKRANQYHIVLDNVNNAVVEMDRGGRITLLNPAWQVMTGFASDTCIGTSFQDYLHPDEQEETVNRLLSSIRHHTDFGTIEARLLTATGGFCWAELHYRPIYNNKGELKSIVGTLTNITQRKKAEDLLQAGHRTLISLVDNLPGMVYRGRNDHTWAMEYLNDMCYDLTGYDALELLNNNRVIYNDLIHPDDREMVWEVVQDHLKEDIPYHLIYRIITRQKQVKWVSEHGRGVYSSSGDLLALEGFITDITCLRPLSSATASRSV